MKDEGELQESATTEDFSAVQNEGEMTAQKTIFENLLALVNSDPKYHNHPKVRHMISRYINKWDNDLQFLISDYKPFSLPVPKEGITISSEYKDMLICEIEMSGRLRNVLNKPYFWNDYYFEKFIAYDLGERWIYSKDVEDYLKEHPEYTKIDYNYHLPAFITLKDITQYTEKQMLCLYNYGKKSHKELLEILRIHHMRFRK